MTKQERRSGRGRRLGERRRAGGARAKETKDGKPRRRLTLERRSGSDRRSIGALDAILSPRDES